MQKNIERERKSDEGHTPLNSPTIAERIRKSLENFCKIKQARDASGVCEQKEKTKSNAEKLAEAGYRQTAIESICYADSRIIGVAREIQNAFKPVVILCGAAYTGKTTIAALIANWRVDRGKVVGRCVTLYAMGQALKASFNAGSDAEQRALARTRWLVIDDIHRSPAWATVELENLAIERADNNLPTLLIGSAGCSRNLSQQVRARAHIIDITWTPYH